MSRHVWVAVLIVGLAWQPARAADGDSLVRIDLFGTNVGSGPRIAGSGNVIDEARPLSGYSALVLTAPVDVTLKAGSSERVTVRADDNILPLIETRVVDGRLEIGTRSGAAFSTRRPLRATVEFKRLDAIRIMSSGDVRADTISTPVLEIVVKGSGDVKIDRIDVNALAVSVAGSGDVTAGGRAARVGVVVLGSGDVDLRGVEAREAGVRIAGSGDVAVSAAEKLDADISGSGDVRYRGSPKINKTGHGAGTVVPLQ